jgi:hypothetical protein
MIHRNILPLPTLSSRIMRAIYCSRLPPIDTGTAKRVKTDVYRLEIRLSDSTTKFLQEAERISNLIGISAETTRLILVYVGLT